MTVNPSTPLYQPTYNFTCIITTWIAITVKFRETVEKNSTSVALFPLSSTYHPPPGILLRGWCWHWCCPGCVAGSWFSPLLFPLSESVWLKVSGPALAAKNSHGNAYVLHGSAQDHPEASSGPAHGAMFWSSQRSGWGSWWCSCHPHWMAQNPPDRPHSLPGEGSEEREAAGREDPPLQCWEACPHPPVPGLLLGRRVLQVWKWLSCEVRPCSPPLLHHPPLLRLPHPLRFQHFRPGRCWMKPEVEPSPGHSRCTGRLERRRVAVPVVSAGPHSLPSLGGSHSAHWGLPEVEPCR